MSDDQFKAINDQFAKINKRFDENDDQFAKINERLDFVDKRFDASDDQFARLYSYVENRFSAIEEKIEATASQASIDRLANTIDRMLRRFDDMDIEQAARDAKFERLLDWAREVSAKTGIPLKDL